MADRPAAVNWLQLRHALRMTQKEMADLLFVTERQIRRLECGSDRPRHATLMLLRSQLQRPELQQRLRLAKFPNPFEETG